MEHLLAVLERRLHAAVAARAPRHLFLHAGVVGWGDRAIILPGASGSGKSTLVMALVSAGASYLSDEFAVIDSAGMVHPFPRRLSVRSNASGTADRLDLAAHAPQGSPESCAMSLAAVVLTRYAAGATWHVAPLDHPSAVLALCEHALSMERDARQSLAIIGQLVATTPVVRGTRGEAADTASRLLRDISRIDTRNQQPAGAGHAA